MKVCLRNEEAGFTILEALIALMLSSVILLFLGTSLQQLNKINQLVIADAQFVTSEKLKVRGSRQVEWHMFLNQLEGYLQDTEFVAADSQSFRVNEYFGSEKPSRVKYGCSRSGSLRFYRSKDNGHNIMLTDIKRYQLTVDGQWLILYFTFYNNEKYCGRIWVESWAEEAHLEKN